MRRWASLLVLIAVSAWGSQHVNQMPSGINWSRWGLAVGKVNCRELDPSAQDGDMEYCSAVDGSPGCVEGSDPCTCADVSTDAGDVFAYRDHGRWRCDGQFACSDISTCLGCLINGVTCSSGAECCSGFCNDNNLCANMDLCPTVAECPCVAVGNACTAT